MQPTTETPKQSKRTVKNHAPQASGGLTATETMKTSGEIPPDVDAAASPEIAVEETAKEPTPSHTAGQVVEEIASEDQQKQEEKPKPRLPAIMAYENKYLEAKDLDSRYRLAQAFFRGGMVPKGYNDAASVFSGMELALELNMKPFTALRNIAVINGRPSLWGDAPLALVKRSGKLARIEEFLFDADYNRICFDNKNLNAKPYGAICRTWMSGDGERFHETYFTIDDARTAGLLPGKADSAWFKYQRRMLQMRARTQNLKDQAPDVLLGIEIAEYDYNYIPQKDVTPGGKVLRDGTIEKDVAAEINKTLGGPEPKENGAITNKIQ